MDHIHEVHRFHHYSINTEKSYVKWILQQIRIQNKRHPKEMQINRGTSPIIRKEKEVAVHGENISQKYHFFRIVLMQIKALIRNQMNKYLPPVHTLSAWYSLLSFWVTCIARDSLCHRPCCQDH